MRKLLIGLLVLLVAGWIGYLVSQDPGYVLISYGTWSIETSFWVAIVALLLAYLLLYVLFRIFRLSALIPERFRRWGSRRKGEKGRKQTSIGLCELAEGHFAKAEKILSKAAVHHELPIVNYLAAAKAASAQHADDRSKVYLDKAQKLAPSAKLAIGLTKAQLQLNQKQWLSASTTLEALLKLSPNHPHILRLLQQAYVELEKWPELEKLLTPLRKNKVLPNQYETLEQQVYHGLLMQAAQTSEAELEKQWKNTPKSLRLQPSFVAQYGEFLMRANLGDKAVKLLELAINKQWSTVLIELYGRTITSTTAEQIQFAEKWLPEHPEDATLLLTLGRLCAREKLWGKAKDYLQQSININPQRQTYFELAGVQEALGNIQAALETYRRTTAM